MKSKWFRRMLAGALSAAMCCGMLTGCGGKQETANSLLATFLGLDGYYQKKDGTTSNYYLDSFAAIKDAYPGLKLDYNFTSQLNSICDITMESHANGEDVQALNDYKAYVEKMMMRSELDLVEGNSRNVDFPDADIIDWNKMMQSGHFASLDDLNTDGDEWEQLPLSENFYYDEELCAVPIKTEVLTYLSSSEEKLAEWDYVLPKDDNSDTDILMLLSSLADWVTAHQDDPSAPYVMPDYLFQRLYLLTFDYIDRNMVNYANQTARFDTPEVRQAVEYLKIIRTRVYQTDLRDKTAYDDSVEGFSEGRYLFCLAVGEGTAFGVIPTSLDGKRYECAIKWLLIPEASQSKEPAYEMIQQIQTLDSSDYYGYDVPFMKSFGEENWKWYQENYVVIIPNTWVLQLSDLFDSYFDGMLSLDNFCEKMQSRLEIYVTE